MGIKESAKELGKKGGLATLKKYGNKHFSAMGKKSKRGPSKRGIKIKKDLKVIDNLPIGQAMDYERE
jgi:hypothetical protein